jgi:hypothetical protein
VSNFSFCFRWSLLNGSSHVHTFFNVKLDDNNLVYIMFKLGMENKQYEKYFNKIKSDRIINIIINVKIV